MRDLLGALFLTLLLCALPPVAAGQDEAGSSCIVCHASMPGQLGEPVEVWRGSIHAENGIGCHSCHGGDPTINSMEAMSPERGFVGVPAETEIPSFCGKCHAGVAEDYLQSAHGAALGEGGPQCVTCHGNHAVQQATIDLINPQLCTQCHGYERAEEIRSALLQTDRMISDLQTSIGRLHRIGIDTEEMAGTLFATRNDFHRLFHSVDVQQVTAQTASFQERLGAVEQEVVAFREELKDRRLAGGVVVGLLAIATLLAGILRRSYKKEEEREDPSAGRGPL